VPEFDTIIVPGGIGIFDAFDDPALSEWLRQQHRRTRRVCAICNGLFALGPAGLLDNRVVTTHWMDVQRLSATFPKARLEPDHIYVNDGNIYTTAGVTAGIDLSLALIEEDFGKAMALDVAKYLVVYLRRAGGQSEFSPLLESQAVPESQTSALQQYMLDNLHVDHTAGTGAFGEFVPTADISDLTVAKVFMQGTKTPVFVRFSTVMGYRGSPEQARDPRGFAIKFYTTQGNWDLVGINWPIFFIRDAIKVPDFVHANKPSAVTGVQDPNLAFDFFAHTPEATNMLTHLYTDEGMPDSYRQMDVLRCARVQACQCAGPGALREVPLQEPAGRARHSSTEHRWLDWRRLESDDERPVWCAEGRQRSEMGPVYPGAESAGSGEIRLRRP
jgi:hypothetical protein